MMACRAFMGLELSLELLPLPATAACRSARRWLWRCDLAASFSAASCSTFLIFSGEQVRVRGDARTVWKLICTSKHSVLKRCLLCPA